MPLLIMRQVFEQVKTSPMIKTQNVTMNAILKKFLLFQASIC
ncbi:hypothetical protein [Marinobacter sp.]